MKTVSGAQLTKFGIGTMRIKDHHGIQHGLKHFNVIDTASHFRQELIPKAIRDREAVFLISKAGFKRKDHGFESDISVGFLKQELERSLLELKSDYIDCFMLNHPERLMPVHGTRTFDLIQEGLLFFEEMVQNGVLRSYGIASNTIGAPRSPDYLSLSKILEHAPPNFKAVEFPLNVFEMDCFEQGFDGSPSLMDLLQHNQIYPFTQRPLTCVIPQGVRQLVETQVDPEIDTKILESFERVTDLELEIVARVSVEESASLAKFAFSQLIADNLNRLVENPMACQLYFERDVIPALLQDLASLEGHQEWKQEYEQQVRELMHAVVQIAYRHQNQSNAELNQMLQTLGSQPLKLQQNALKACATMNFGTVLVGMHKPEYVDQVAAIQGTFDPEDLERLLMSPYFV